MTTRQEEINAVYKTRHFLMDLLDPQKTPKVPKYIRQEASNLLKHYPLMVAEFLAFCGPHDHDDIEENPIPDAIYSRYGKKRTITQVGVRTFLVAGESRYMRGSEDMFDFEGGPCYVVGDDFYGSKIVNVRHVEHGVLITVEEDKDNRVTFDDVVERFKTRFNEALDRLSDTDEELGLE